MKNTDSKTILLSLIKDDLINTRLIAGLQAMGIDASHYLLGISDAIFLLMGINTTKHNEALFEYYIQLRKKAQHFHPGLSPKAFEILALEIYEKMLERVDGK